MNVTTISPFRYAQALAVNHQLAAPEKAVLLLACMQNADLFSEQSLLRQKLMHVTTQLGVSPADNQLQGCAPKWLARAMAGFMGHQNPFHETVLTIGMADALAAKYDLPLADFSRQVDAMTDASPLVACRPLADEIFLAIAAPAV